MEIWQRPVWHGLPAKTRSCQPFQQAGQNTSDVGFWKGYLLVTQGVYFFLTLQVLSWHLTYKAMCFNRVQSSREAAPRPWGFDCHVRFAWWFVQLRGIPRSSGPFGNIQKATHCGNHGGSQRQAWFEETAGSFQGNGQNPPTFWQPVWVQMAPQSTTLNLIPSLPAQIWPPSARHQWWHSSHGGLPAGQGPACQLLVAVSSLHSGVCYILAYIWQAQVWAASRQVQRQKWPAFLGHRSNTKIELSWMYLYCYDSARLEFDTWYCFVCSITSRGSAGAPGNKHSELPADPGSPLPQGGEANQNPQDFRLLSQSQGMLQNGKSVSANGRNALHRITESPSQDKVSKCNAGEPSNLDTVTKMIPNTAAHGEPAVETAVEKHRNSWLREKVTDPELPATEDEEEDEDGVYQVPETISSLLDSISSISKGSLLVSGWSQFLEVIPW